MGQHGDRSREALMSAAEELFAQHGVDGVSNRQIAELAGQSNHSAVAYHFGGKDELLRALVSRQRAAILVRQQELVETLDEHADVRALIACRVMPWIEQLAVLPHPSWRARFLSQLPTVPAAVDLIAELTADGASPSDFIGTRLASLLAEIPAGVLAGRIAVLSHMVIGVCASYEREVQIGAKDPRWIGVGNFLIDACAGMLSAPVTEVDEATIPTGIGLV